MSERKILVLGDDLRSFLTIVRSLGARGFTIDACPFNFVSPALHSRYIRRIFRLPHYNLSPETWLSSLMEITKKEQYNLIIPCDDRTILPLHKHLESFSGQQIALPNNQAIEVFYDKFKTREIAKKCGVAIAKGRILRDDDYASGLVEEFGLPLAIKPRKSYVMGNLVTRQKVKLARNLRDVEDSLSLAKNRQDFIVESCFNGFGVGVSVLANNGRILQVFEHHRVNEPASGGGSSYRVSAPVNPVLEDAVKRLTKAAKLTGVAMFEFRQNANKADEAILIEVNARFWGSLPLPVAAGVDFPSLLYDMVVNGKEAPRQQYKSPYYCRNVTSDFYCIWENFAEIRKNNLNSALNFLFVTASSFFRVFTFKEKHDSFDWNDLRPALTEYKNLLLDIAIAIGKRIPILENLRASKTRKKASYYMNLGKNKPLKILFLCQGNICRSPFAGLLFANKMRAIDHSLTITSAGMIPRNGRHSPPNAIECANEWGIDLYSHRSKYTTDEELLNADVIIVFDEINLESLRSRGLPLTAPIIRLGDLIDDKPGQVLDPYGQDLYGFRKAYKEIDSALTNLSNFLK